MALKVLKSGLQLTIQDKGRYESMSLGVPISGVMDTRLSDHINKLLGNEISLPVIEMLGQAIKFQFEKPTYFCFGAISAQIYLNDAPIEAFKVYKVKPFDVLHIERVSQGMWSYLAVKGGFLTQLSFKSSSYYSNILDSSKLSKDDLVHYKAFEKAVPKVKISSLNIEATDLIQLQCFELPEFNLLTETIKHQLLTATFTVSHQINRMAYQLSERLDNKLGELKTAPVLPGTVQFTSGGKLIVLMRDAQVTGGYPRIFQLTEESISQLAQAKPRQKIRFNLSKPV